MIKHLMPFLFILIISAVQSQNLIKIDTSGPGYVCMNSKISNPTGYLELFKHPQKDHIIVTTGDFKYYFFRDSIFQIDGINIIDKFIFALDTQKIVRYIFISVAGTPDKIKERLDSLFTRGIIAASSSNNMLHLWKNKANTFQIIMTTNVKNVGLNSYHTEIQFISLAIKDWEIVPFVSLE